MSIKSYLDAFAKGHLSYLAKSLPGAKRLQRNIVEKRWPLRMCGEPKNWHEGIGCYFILTFFVVGVPSLIANPTHATTAGNLNVQHQRRPKAQGPDGNIAENVLTEETLRRKNSLNRWHDCNASKKRS